MNARVLKHLIAHSSAPSLFSSSLYINSAILRSPFARTTSSCNATESQRQLLSAKNRSEGFMSAQTRLHTHPPGLVIQDMEPQRPDRGSLHVDAVAVAQQVEQSVDALCCNQIRLQTIFDTICQDESPKHSRTSVCIGLTV